MPAITPVAIQSVLLKAAANFTAQTFTHWNAQSPGDYDWTRVAEFAAFGILSAPLALAWQRLLEDYFPSQRIASLRPATTVSSTKKQDDKFTAKLSTQTQSLNWSNILIKLVLDHTIGQFLINRTFLLCTNGARIQSWSLLHEAIRARIFGFIWASWRLWPWVALINFIWVPVQWRVLVSSLVGFGWNIFLSLWSIRR